MRRAAGDGTARPQLRPAGSRRPHYVGDHLVRGAFSPPQGDLDANASGQLNVVTVEIEKTSAAIDKVELQLSETEKSLSKLDAELAQAEDFPAVLPLTAAQLARKREEKKQLLATLEHLRNKEKQLRDEKKQLLDLLPRGSPAGA